MALLARMYVEEVKSLAYQSGDNHAIKRAEIVTAAVVYSNDPKSPNFSFSEATPSGTLLLEITNKDAWGELEAGDIINLEIRKMRVSTEKVEPMMRPNTEITG